MSRNDVFIVNDVLKDVVQRHLEVCAFASPRDILLYLAKDNHFRLLPKMLIGLASILDKIERSYRKNLTPGMPFLVQLEQPLLLHEGNGNIIITPTMTNKLVTLYGLFCRTDRCLRAYVSRHKATSKAAPEKVPSVPKYQAIAAPVQELRYAVTAGPVDLAAESVQHQTAAVQPPTDSKYQAATAPTATSVMLSPTVPTGMIAGIISENEVMPITIQTTLNPHELPILTRGSQPQTDGNTDTISSSTGTIHRQPVAVAAFLTGLSQNRFDPRHVNLYNR